MHSMPVIMYMYCETGIIYLRWMTNPPTLQLEHLSLLELSCKLTNHSITYDTHTHINTYTHTIAEIPHLPSAKESITLTCEQLSFQYSECSFIFAPSRCHSIDNLQRYYFAYSLLTSITQIMNKEKTLQSFSKYSMSWLVVFHDFHSLGLLCGHSLRYCIYKLCKLVNSAKTNETFNSWQIYCNYKSSPFLLFPSIFREYGYAHHEKKKKDLVLIGKSLNIPTAHVWMHGTYIDEKRFSLKKVFVWCKVLVQ